MLFRPVTIGERKVSRLRASWLLLKESWRFLRADSELLLVPVVATIVMVMLFGVFSIGMLISGIVIAGESAATSGIMFVAGVYLIASFSLALAQAVVTNTVNERAHGRNATFAHSLGAAVRRFPALFVWALISATVGVVLRVISEQSERFGRFGLRLLGAGWALATYFVVPAIIIDKKSALAALPHSTSVFRKAWGESLVTVVSLNLIFLVLHMLAILVFFGCFYVSVEQSVPQLFVVAGIAYVIWLFGALSLKQVLDSVVVTLLYIYANTNTSPANFNPELLSVVVARTSAAQPVSSASSSSSVSQ